MTKQQHEVDRTKRLSGFLVRYIIHPGWMIDVRGDPPLGEGERLMVNG